MEPIRVFIVEDDPMVANINMRFTERIAPFKVVGISITEVDAINQIQEKLPDLVLLDIYLTQGNGLNVLRQIRNTNLPIDIILVTAAKDTPTIHETLRYGAIDYLIKPFNLERLQKALNNYRQLRQAITEYPDREQSDVDLLNSFTHTITSPAYPIPSAYSLPKGVHQLTLEQIEKYLERQKRPLSCQEIALELAMSKITVWRYLEYLVEIEKVIVELVYGAKGRPTKRYVIKY